MSAKTVKGEDKTYELYLEERRVLIAAQRETAASFDKAILTLSSGAFTVSLLFLKDIVPTPFPNTKWLLGVSWLFFGLNILTILVGFLASQTACARQIDLCEGELLKNEKGKNAWATFARICNWASILMLAIASVFSGLFLYWNYIRG